MNIPTTYDGFRQYWANNQQTAISSYIAKNKSFIPNLLPEQAVQMPAVQLAYMLEKRFGQQAFFQALNPDNTVESPVKDFQDGAWLKTVNMVGINVRTIGSFWNVVKYTLTLPEAQSSVHLLPIWECGVVASLYGIASWNINPEFYDAELAIAFPHLNTVEKQLKVVVNLLHLMGKTVGMDVIPHTDRYSEVSLANPQFFEWLQRREFEIINHTENLHEKVQERILDFLYQYGGTISEYYPRKKEDFFNNSIYPEADRLRFLFGEKTNLEARNKRRNQLINHLFSEGYEPVPATMAPPYRGLEVDFREEAKTVDDDGRVWRDYVITKPEGMSRVFGPLARVKLYECKNDNQDWEIDFTKPRTEVWEYMADKYLKIAQTYHFDFMRGDMSHVQMNPAGTPTDPDVYYDIHKYIKNAIRQAKPYFGYFAESFLAPPNTMAYGVEEDHLEGSDTDTTLGDLQSMVVGTNQFVSEFARYHYLLRTRTFAPNFTIMTADKDDPRFDEFYLKGNELRMFIGLFLTDMPSYMALGFEQRDPHPTPAPNEHYTKLYVFQLSEGEKATHGKYVWGQNGVLFGNLTALKCISEKINNDIKHQKTKWLIEPDFNGEQKVIAWTQAENPKYIFVINLSLTQISVHEALHSILTDKILLFSTEQKSDFENNISIILPIPDLKEGECRIYQV
ncbi:MAG: hypothetical protein MUF58_14425 [Arcicella sp.]|jgi:hypothetical protein|nr:hypothetical protein [Arcicella sp.]